MRRFVAVVLAAGRGERAGGPKALAATRTGVPLAVAHAMALERAGAAEVLVVVREDVAHALAPSLPRSARVIVSREPEPDGPAGSLRAAFDALQRAAAPLVLVTPVDKRVAPPTVVARLLDAIERGAAASRATHEGRGGHPVMVRAEHLAPYGPGGPERPLPLRDVLRALGSGPSGLVDVESGEPALDDLDDAAALRRVLVEGDDHGR